MKSLIPSNCLAAAGLLALLPAGSLRAQDGPGPGDHRYSIMLGTSMTGTGDLEFSGLALGEVETTRYHMEASYTIPSGEGLMFELGLEYDLLQTDHSLGTTLVPEDLTTVALNLRAFWNINEKWSIMANLSPGFYGDDEASFSDAFNAPLMVLGQWQKTENFSVSFGLRVDTVSDMPVLPVLGVNWKINPEWELSLGLPKTELRYKVDDQLSFYTGMDLDGGTYAVGNKALVAPNGRSLGDTHVSMSEFRGLLGMEYQFHSGLKLTVEGGYAFDRKIDYYDRDVELDVDAGAFGALSVSYSF